MDRWMEGWGMMDGGMVDDGWRDDGWGMMDVTLPHYASIYQKCFHQNDYNVCLSF